MNRIARLMSTLALCGLAASAAAQTYPTKPVRLVVPFAAGGSTDAVARALADKLGQGLGQPVQVENMPGAGGTLGAAFVAKAPADGHTLMLATVSTMAVAGALYERLPYDATTSFSPIVEIATIPQLLVVHPSVQAKSVKELIALAKSKPNGLTVAGGSGSANHLATELLMKMAGIKLDFVSFRGSGPALSETLSGKTDMMFDVVMTSLPHVKAGKLRALAVTSKTRSPLMPDVPTMDESGLPGYETIIWFGLVGPAGMPPEAVRQLNAEVQKALKTQALQALLVSQGAELVGGTPQQFGAKIKQESLKWGRLVKEAGIKAGT